MLIIKKKKESSIGVQMQPIVTEIRQYTITADRDRAFLAAIIAEDDCRKVTVHYLENQEEKSIILEATGDEKAITFCGMLSLNELSIEIAFIRTDNSKPDRMHQNLSEFVDCTCKKKIQKLEKCVICLVESKYAVYLNDCPVHPNSVLFYGPYECVCESCRNKGWSSTAGRGGGTYHINAKTGERKNKYQ
jgi:hypothetical protein